MSPALTRSAILAAMLFHAACGNPAPGGDATADEASRAAATQPAITPTITDSAGVSIRTWPSAAVEAVTWQVDPRPIFVANGTEGGHEPFHLIASMAFDSDSTLILGEMAMTRLRRYTVGGNFIELVGTAGQGPGEFGAMNYLGFHHDSLVVFDSRWNRISVFDPDYDFVRSFALNPQGSVRFDGMLSDGRIVAMLSSGRDPRRWGLWDLEGQRLEMLDQVPGLPSITVAMLGPSSRGDVPKLRPYLAYPYGAASGSEIAWTDGVEYRVDFYDPVAGLTRSERIDMPAPAVTPELEERWRNNFLSSQRDNPNVAVLERVAAEAEFPERLPALGSQAPLFGPPLFGPPAFLHDNRGRTWVRANPMAPTQNWLVFDKDRGLVGFVVLPGDFELEAIRNDILLGVAEDELEVQTALAFRVR